MIKMEIGQELDKLKKRIIDTAIFGATIVMLPTLLLSLYRIVLFGWKNVYYIHIIVFVSAFCLLALKERMKNNIKIHLLTIIILIISFTTLINFALTGAGFVFFAMGFIPIVLYSKRVAIAYAIIYFAGFFIITHLHNISLISPAVDFNAYMDTTFVWIAHGIMYAFIVFYIGYMLNLYYTLYLQSLKSSLEYSNELQASLKDVNFQKNRFTLFMDAYPFHVTIKDENQRYVFGNKAILDFMQVGREALPGMATKDVFSEEISKQLDQSDQVVIDTKAPVNEEISIYLDNGEYKCYELIKFPLVTQDNKILIGGISIDITRQKQAENELIESEKRYRAIFEGSTDGIVFLDEEFDISDCNLSYCELMGYAKDDLLGQNYKITLRDKSYDWDRVIVDLAAESRFDSQKIELEGLKKDGQVVYGDCTVYKLKKDNKQLIWAVVRDLSEKKRLEAEIYKTMLDAEEKERSRFAREIHDGLGPLLSTSLVYLHTIGKENKLDKVYKYSKRIYELLEDASYCIKEISNNISPDILNRYGLVQAIQSFCEKVKFTKDINFLIKSNLDCRIEKTIEYSVYRVITELINNTIKHSQANQIKIDVEINSGLLFINYEDNGEGFNYKTLKEQVKGFGLLNLENRIEKLGGQYVYYSEPGEGVKVTMRIKTNCCD